jgi:RHS repeat-associated protein
VKSIMPVALIVQVPPIVALALIGTGMLSVTRMVRLLIQRGTAILTMADGTYTYPTQIGPQSVNVTYQPYTVQTAFGCAGISEYGPVSTKLISRITLPDGSFYSFTYEPTPGFPTSVTARLTSVTLPSGGTISYNYPTNANICGDNIALGKGGLPPILVRTEGTNPPTTYDTTTAPNTTIITRPTSSQTVYTFTTSSIDETLSSQPFVTHEKVYSGNQGASVPLLDVQTCYNSQSPPCDVSNYSTGNPITKVSTYVSNDAGPASGTDTVWDSNGNQTETDYYDWGSTASRGSIIKKDVKAYVNLNPNFPQYAIGSETIQDGNGNPVSSTSYGYDESPLVTTSNLPNHSSVDSTNYPRRNATTVTNCVSFSSGNCSSSISTKYQFDDAGVVRSSSFVASGHSWTTSYAYDATDTFLTSTTLPTPSSGSTITTTSSFDVASGGLNSTSGANSGQITSYTHNDPYERLTKVQTPDSGVSQISYTQNETTTSQQISPSETRIAEAFADTFGRPIRSSVRSDLPGATSPTWYITDTCYDVEGRIQYQSLPYPSSTDIPIGDACSTSTATKYTYDALNRKTRIDQPDSSYTQMTFLKNSVKKASSSGVSRISQTDSLGRPKYVCEISSNASMPNSGSPVSCGLDISGTGFITSYAYDLADHITTLSQGVQSRTFQTDAIGNMLYQNEPESGVTAYTYAYNSTGLVRTRTRPQANVSSLSAPNPTPLTTTTTQYDDLGRTLSVSYSDGTLAKQFVYDVVPGSGFAGASNGQLVASSVTSSSGVVDSQTYTYDIAGRISQYQECAPGWCASGNMFTTHWYSYLPGTTQMSSQKYTTSLGASGTQAPPIQYGYTLDGKLASVSGGQNNSTLQPTIYLAQAMSPFGPSFARLGNGLNTAYTYSNIGGFASQQVCSGVSSNGCPSGSTIIYSTAISTVGNQVSASADSVNGGQGYSYDEFGRLMTVTPTTGSTSLAMNFVYDRWGNRTGQNVTGGSGPQPQSAFSVVTNQATSASGYTYDISGNVINDSWHTYSYDAENNLIAIDGGSTATYLYNSSNQRVYVSTPAGAERYSFDILGRRLTAWNNSGVLDSAQYYTGSQKVAYWLSSDNNIHFEHQDWLGTERMRTNAAGVQEGAYTSLPFGDGQSAAGTNTNPAHFAQMDSDLAISASLDHGTFREYQATSGRWSSPDPYSGSYVWKNPQSFNRYSYGANSPLSHVDPLGLLSACSPDDPDCVDVNCDDCWEVDGPFVVDPQPYTGTIDSGESGSGPTCPGCSKPGQTVRECADEIANDFSMAGMLPGGIGLKNNFFGGVLSGLLGNSIAGVTDYFDQFTSHRSPNGPSQVYGTLLSGGLLLGIPFQVSSAGPKGPLGVVQDYFMEGASSFARSVAIDAAVAKIGVDGAIYIAALNYCYTGKY